MSELCEEQGLNTDLILTVLNVYLDESFVPDHSLPLFDAESIADYFHQTVESYIHDLIPNIEKHLNAFIAMSGPEKQELKLLREIFQEFKERMTLYLRDSNGYEEEFPDELLHDLKQILIKHLSPGCNQNLCHAVIFSLHSFQKDLEAHNRLRDRVLLPKAVSYTHLDVYKRQGREFAVLFAERKCDLVLVARSADQLEELKEALSEKHGVHVHTIVKDLAAPNAVNELFREVKALGVDVDYVVNNAGFGDHGAFVDTQWERYEEMIALNVEVLTHLSHLYARDWAGRKRGRIVNISSTAAFQPGPMMAVYFATKAYVLHLSEALNHELRSCLLYTSRTSRCVSRCCWAWNRI